MKIFKRKAPWWELMDAYEKAPKADGRFDYRFRKMPGELFGKKGEEPIVFLKQLEMHMRKGDEIGYGLIIKSIRRNPDDKRQALVEVEIKEN